MDKVNFLSHIRVGSGASQVGSIELRSLIGQQKKTTAINEDSETNRPGKVASTDKARIQSRSIDETLNARLDAEAYAVCGARRYERSPDGMIPLAGHYDRKFHTKTCEVRPSPHWVAVSRERKPIQYRLFKLDLRAAALLGSLPLQRVQPRSA